MNWLALLSVTSLGVAVTLQGISAFRDASRLPNLPRALLR